VRLEVENPPEGAKWLGYESYVVQELIIKTETTKYQRARYALPGGGSVLAPFPPGVLPIEGGHFGANLIAYILDQYHQAHVTEPLLLEQLWEYGIDISSGQTASHPDGAQRGLSSGEGRAVGGGTGGVVLHRHG